VWLSRRAAERRITPNREFAATLKPWWPSYKVSIVIDRLDLAERVRLACVQAALDGYERAGVSGLCGEGRWEIAVEALRNLDLMQVLAAETESKRHPAAPVDEPMT
jgi:hypothetical protein